MMKNNPMFDELAKLASGAAGSVLEMKRELEAYAAAKVEHLVSKLELVSREEFEVVRLMALKALEENEKLKSELQALKEVSK